MFKSKQISSHDNVNSVVLLQGNAEIKHKRFISTVSSCSVLELYHASIVIVEKTFSVWPSKPERFSLKGVGGFWGYSTAEKT